MAAAERGFALSRNRPSRKSRPSELPRLLLAQHGDGGGLPQMRQKLIVGNWKMFTTAATARQLAADIVNSLGSETRVCVGVCPPAPYLGVVGEVVRGTMI